MDLYDFRDIQDSFIEIYRALLRICGPSFANMLEAPIHVYTFTYMDLYDYGLICMIMDRSVCLWMDLYVCTAVDLCTSIHVFMYINLFMYACTSLCMSVRAYKC